MPRRRIIGDLDWTARGRARMWLLTVLGTLLCIAVAFTIDSYSFATGQWRLGGKPINNVIIPLVLAPPFLWYLLSKLRELAVAHEELLAIASTDSLTACLNRRAFTAMVEGYLDRAAREQAQGEGALLVVDIDHFKSVNDRFGHDQGDEALRLIAAAIRGAVREIDIVGRMGGEEFGVFLPGLSPERTALVAERIRAAIQLAYFAPGGCPHALSASIGGALIDRQTDFVALYRTADHHLYAAKRDGRDRVDIAGLPPPARVVPMLLH